MELTDLDDMMEIERLSFRAPWSRQVFVEELDREWAYVEVICERAPQPRARRGKTTNELLEARASSGRRAVLGFINYWLVRDEVHILNLAIHPDQRRRGHASRLLAHVIDFARREVCRYITLEVRRSNHGAIHVYRKYGFRPVGVRPNYYVEDNEDAIVMLLELPEGGGS
jgi:ribosomal-protein-alanine N-acetyltransferase